MNNFKKFTVIMLLVSSFFMTGCDMAQIIDVISKVAEGVTKAIPAIKGVVDTIKGALPNNDNPATASATTTVATTTATVTTPAVATPTTVIDTTTTASPATAIDNNTGNDAEIKVTPANDDEEVTAPGANG